jgi:hypothetical protein
MMSKSLAQLICKLKMYPKINLAKKIVNILSISKMNKPTEGVYNKLYKFLLGCLYCTWVFLWDLTGKFPIST